jgi:hypothetical protein
MAKVCGINYKKKNAEVQRSEKWNERTNKALKIQRKNNGRFFKIQSSLD